MQNGRRAFVLALLLATPLALAQEEDPTVNDSDYNTTVPTEDETYLDEAAAESSEDPTVSDSDFDTSVPAEDESYLDEPLPGDEGGATARGTPGAAAAVALVGIALTALALRRRA